MLIPQIITIAQKKLVGKKLKMSLTQNKTVELWRSFMPKRMGIGNKIGQDLISLSVYNGTVHMDDHSQEFEKWAAVEVSDFDAMPEEMESFVLQGGLYAVFNYKGLNTDVGIFIYIFTQWLPNSDFLLDARPHFEVLGNKYKNNDPDSEEEIWIPIKPKQ